MKLDFYIKDFSRTDIGKSVITIIVISSLFNSLFYDNVMGLFAVLIISLAMQKAPDRKAKQNEN